MNYTYLVKCADNTLYCGWTNHLEKRIEAHNSGKGAKYTNSRKPVTLVYYEEFETKEEAMRREAAIKKMAKADKLKLIETKKPL
jgi:putative endonuclease